MLPLLAPVPRRYVLVTPARIFKLQPFRNVKRDFCRTPSIGFNGHRYSNLFDGGSSSFNPSLPALLLYSYLLSLSFSSTFAFFPATKTVTRNRCELPGVGKGTGKKEFASRSFFFLLRLSILVVWIWSGSRVDRCTHPHVVTVRSRYFGRRFLRRKI